MQYLPKYKFAWLDEVGNAYQILLEQKDYAGRPPKYKGHALGGAPVITRVKNDNVLATSLSFMAEAKTEGDFRELYTSDPFEFRVRVMHGTSLVWLGYVTTETYSEDEKPVPYDVRVTAIDGLTRLKDDPFQPGEIGTLEMLLRYLLEDTGRDTYILSSSLRTQDLTAAQLLSGYLDLSNYIDGETSKYEVLQAVLRSLNACITPMGSDWYIFRETDLAGLYDDEAEAIQTGTGSYPVLMFGQMGTNDIWPIGHMTKNVKAAKKRVTVVAPNKYRTPLTNPGMTYEGSWTPGPGGNPNTWSDADHYTLRSGSGGIFQSVTMKSSEPETLILKVRGWTKNPEGSNLYARIMYWDPDEPGMRYLWNSTYEGGQKEWMYWTPSQTAFVPYMRCEYVNGIIDDMTEFQVTFPNPGAGKVVNINLLGSNANVVVYDCYLELQYQFDGVTQHASINNGALYADNEVEVCLTPYALDGYQHFVYGALQDSYGTTLQNLWSSAKLPASSYIEFIAKDYALSKGLPRLQRTGRLHYPGTDLPMYMSSDAGATLYVVENCDWDLLNCELNVTLVSIPTTAVADLTTGNTQRVVDMTEHRQRNVEKRLKYIERIVRR